MKKYFTSLIIWFCLAILFFSSSCSSVTILNDRNQAKPGTGHTVHMAQATWDTGWFQAQVFKLLLEELGYQVKGPETIENVAFYIFSAQGDVDFWTNGWFPIHDRFLEFDQVSGKVEPVGYLVENGALQGYMIDKESAEKLHITNLGDFQDPEVAKLFDRDGNGKADLIGCDEEWGCEVIIEHQLDEFRLDNTVEHVQGNYSELMEETILRYRNGEPVLFYTWTPNWTVSELKIGEDVMWLSVPYSSTPGYPEAQTGGTNITGCLETPCDLGFEYSDIRVVANSEFLLNNPSAATLFEIVTIPLDDIAEQNARMHSGRDEITDLHMDAEDWIQANRNLVDGWLSQARAAAQ